MAMPKKGNFVNVDGVKTHYYEKGRGKTVVLVHGGNFGSAESSGNSWTWSRNFDYLARKFRVIAVAKLGQGYTGNPRRDSDYTMHAVVQHLGAFLRQLKLENTQSGGPFKRRLRDRAADPGAAGSGGFMHLCGQQYAGAGCRHERGGAGQPATPGAEPGMPALGD